MCSLLANRDALEGFNELHKAGDGHWKDDLIKDAHEESTSTSGAYDIRLYRVPQWNKLPEIKNLMKLRIGRHRAYSLGHHSECSYTIVFVKPFKRDEQDSPESKVFQKMLIRKIMELATNSSVELKIEPKDD